MKIHYTDTYIRGTCLHETDHILQNCVFLSLPCLWGQEFAYINGKNVATGRCSGRFHLQTCCIQNNQGKHLQPETTLKRESWNEFPLQLPFWGCFFNRFVATNWWCTAKVLAGGLKWWILLGSFWQKVDFHNLISDSAPNYIGDVTLKKILKEHPTTSTTNLFGSHYNCITCLVM